MTMQSLAPMLRTARDNGHAVAQFNVDTVEIAQAVLAVAEDLRSPVILALGQGVDKVGRMEAVAAGVRQLAEAATVPVCLHLDHSESLPQIARAIRLGFTGIMIDASAHPLAYNIEQTRLVLALCAGIGAGVEAELGRIAGVEDDLVVSEDQAGTVDIATVRAFVAAVRPDALAVAVGTAHGFYKNAPKIDFDLIAALRAEDMPPLVLHGGSGLPDDVLARAVSCGIAKMNFATELRHAFVSAVTAAEGSIFDVLRDGAEAAARVARARIAVVGSQDRAWRAARSGLAVCRDGHDSGSS